MEFRFLGTGAAEGWPALFCECAACREAEKRGGRNIRRRSGAMLGSDILIDFPPDLYAMKLDFHLDLSSVRHIVLTHAHSDHFAPDELEFFLPTYAHLTSRSPLTLYGSEYTKQTFDRVADAKSNEIAFRVVKPFERFQAGGAVFTALPAVHSCKESYIYRVEWDDQILLYGNDSGMLTDEVIAYLETQKPFTVVSLDATFGAVENDYTGHMGFPRDIRQKDILLEKGIANKDTRFFLNHFSHNGLMLYEEIEREMGAHGFHSTYDGMVL